MISSVQFPWERRLGRVGANTIKSFLSYFSKTNSVEGDEDIGIDYHCELIEDDHPSITFFVQAKGTEHFKNNWSKGIRKSTILYWLSQKSPVYLIVYDENDRNCYWMSIEDHRYSLFKKLSQKHSKTITIKLDRSHVLERGKNKNHEFIEKIKDDLRSIQQFWGFPQPKGNGYVKIIPSPPRSEWELTQTKENVRMSLYSIIQHYIKKDKQTALLFCRFLAEFDKSHYNHFFWLGQLNREMGNYEEAIESFKEALRICERDLRWPRDSMKSIIEAIHKEIETTYKLQASFSSTIQSDRR
jgi:tetratricopeptide (TPR) repeat protein